MIYNPENKLHQKQALEKIKYFFEKGKRFELKAKHDIRSIPQSRYLHLLFSWFAIETGYTPEEVKQDIFKKHVNSDLFYQGEFNGIVKIERWRSTADLDKAEMTLAIDRFRNFSSMEIGIYLPEPHDLILLQEMENELSKHKNKEYL